MKFLKKCVKNEEKLHVFDCFIKVRKVSITSSDLHIYNSLYLLFELFCGFSIFHKSCQKSFLNCIGFILTLRGRKKVSINPCIIKKVFFKDFCIFYFRRKKFEK